MHLAAVQLPQRRARAAGAEIVEEEKAKRGLDGEVPVFVSSELYPIAPRLAAAQLDRDRGLRRRALARDAAGGPRRDQGARRRLRAARDGLARRHDLDRGRGAGDDAGLGADRRGRRRHAGSPGGSDLPNVLCTDIGGTSFDIALITDGRYEITPTPDIARFLLNMPLVKIDSVGAGCGSFVRIDPNSTGPSSAPTRPARGSASAGRREAWRRSR